MPRNLAARLIIEGVGTETKKQLQEAALQLYGQPNASLIVRELIASSLAKDVGNVAPLTAEQAADTVRVELRLPRVILDKATALAEERFSARNYYLTALILAHFKSPQLQGDEIEVLRRSNYEMAKIGTNLNQIAKAFNILVKIGGGERLPELGKKIASLKREISDHTSKVLRVLKAGTTMHENSGRGSKGTKQRKPKKKYGK